MSLSTNALARWTHIPAIRINDILLQSRGVSANTALDQMHFCGGDVHSLHKLKFNSA